MDQVNLVAQWRGERTQAEIASLLNEQLGRSYDKSNISRWENGDRIPRDVAKFIENEMATTSRSAMVVAVAIEKGGVGKTTTVVTLSGLLAAKGYRVLAIDLDYHGGLTTHVGLHDPARPKSDTAFALMTDEKDEIGLGRVVQPVRAMGVEFDVIPSHIDQNVLDIYIGAEILKTWTDFGNPEHARWILGRMLDHYRPHYDIILLDTPPSYAGMTMMSIVCANQVLIPTEAERLAIDGVDKILDAIETVQQMINPGVEVIGVLATKVVSREKDQILALGQITARYSGVTGILGQIPRTSLFRKAVWRAHTVMEEGREIADAYRRTVDTIEKAMKLRRIGG
jgi:chromosome partitioning protein